MPQPTKIPRAFASSGDKNVIPESTGSIGLASWTEGFPAITSTPFAQGGVAPKRADFNGIFYALSAATVWQQQGGVFEYDNATDYEVGNVCLYSDDLYLCKVANGPSSTVKSPTNKATWAQLISAKGGTLGGALVATTHPALSRNNDNSYLSLCGGTAANVSNGAYMYLYGAGGSQPGAFRIYTGSSSHNLFGKSDGTLTWDGSDIFTVDNCPIASSVGSDPYTYDNCPIASSVGSDPYTYKAKFANGVMIQATYDNFTTNEYSRFDWVYPEAFYEFPFVTVLKVSASRSYNLYSCSKTLARIRVNDMSGASVGQSDVAHVMMIAVGRWK